MMLQQEPSKDRELATLLPKVEELSYSSNQQEWKRVLLKLFMQCSDAINEYRLTMGMVSKVQLCLAGGYHIFDQDHPLERDFQLGSCPKLFGGERLTINLLDRLTHHVLLEMNGESYRFHHNRQQKAKQGKRDSRL